MQSHFVLNWLFWAILASASAYYAKFVAMSGNPDEARANALKQQANAFLVSKDYAKAIEIYSEAISLAPRNHVLFSNRSSALLEVGRIAEAITDAKHCVALAPSWAKGYLREGLALEAKGDLAAAMAALDAGLVVDSKDETLRKCRARLEAASRKAGSASSAPEAAREDAGAQLSAEELLTRARLTAITDPRDASSDICGPVASLVSRHANVALSSTSSRGRCLVATRDIPAFSEVLTDVAAAWLPPFCDQLAMPALVEVAPWLQARGPRALESLLLQVRRFRPRDGVLS